MTNRTILFYQIFQSPYLRPIIFQHSRWISDLQLLTTHDTWYILKNYSPSPEWLERWKHMIDLNTVSSGHLYSFCCSRKAKLSTFKYLFNICGGSNLSQKSLWNIADISCQSGSLGILKYIVEDCGVEYIHDRIDDAVINNDFEMVKYLSETGSLCTKFAIEFAAENGNLDIVSYLSENRTEGCSSDAMDRAAAYGQLHVVTYLSENRTEGCTKNSLIWASEHNHLDVIKYIIENRPSSEYDLELAISSAIQHKRTEILDYLYKAIANKSKKK